MKAKLYSTFVGGGCRAAIGLQARAGLVHARPLWPWCCSAKGPRAAQPCGCLARLTELLCYCSAG
eukprot:12874427-Alexandrium_andersonii.AAC.1